MDDKQQLDEAHRMLDRLGAAGSQGRASIRERLCDLLCRYSMNIPSRHEVIEATYGSDAIASPSQDTRVLFELGCREVPR